MIGTHCIKTWSKTLAVLALSSGEAELMAVGKGATEMLGMRAIMADLGLVINLSASPPQRSGWLGARGSARFATLPLPTSGSNKRRAKG